MYTMHIVLWISNCNNQIKHPPIWLFWDQANTLILIIANISSYTVYLILYLDWILDIQPVFCTVIVCVTSPLHQAQFSIRSCCGISVVIRSARSLNQTLEWRSPSLLADMRQERNLFHNICVRITKVSTRGEFQGVIFSIKFNDDRSQIVSGSDDRTICVWNLPPDWESLERYTCTEFLIYFS